VTVSSRVTVSRALPEGPRKPLEGGLGHRLEDDDQVVDAEGLVNGTILMLCAPMGEKFPPRTA
jgi:hypothetical protein